MNWIHINDFQNCQVYVFFFAIQEKISKRPLNFNQTLTYHWIFKEIHLKISSNRNHNHLFKSVIYDLKISSNLTGRFHSFQFLYPVASERYTGIKKTLIPGRSGKLSLPAHARCRSSRSRRQPSHNDRLRQKSLRRLQMWKPVARSGRGNRTNSRFSQRKSRGIPDKFCTF